MICNIAGPLAWCFSRKEGMILLPYVEKPVQRNEEEMPPQNYKSFQQRYIKCKELWTNICAFPFISLNFLSIEVRVTRVCIGWQLSTLYLSCTVGSDHFSLCWRTIILGSRQPLYLVMKWKSEVCLRMDRPVLKTNPLSTSVLTWRAPLSEESFTLDSKDNLHLSKASQYTSNKITMTFCSMFWRDV